MNSRCSPLTPEADVIRLAARVQLGPSHRESLIARLSSTLDWPLLLHLIERHRLAPLVYQHVNALAPAKVPRPILVELWRRHEHHARRNVQLRDRMTAAAQELEWQGIACIPYKGAVLAEALYGAIGLRAFDDIDLLVRRADLDRATAILEARGYVPYYQIDRAAAQAMVDARLQYHIVLRGASPEHLLELHWKSDPWAPVERDDDAWWQRRALSAEETLLLNCIHAMRHHGYRLCWLVDIAEQLRQQSAIDWRPIFDRARAIGAGKRLMVALLMAHDVLDAPLPAHVLEELRADVSAKALATKLADHLFLRDGGQLTASERTRIDLAMCDSAAGRFRFAMALLFEPSFHELTEWPLPRALFPLYAPLRIVRLLRKYVSTRSWRTGQTALDGQAGGAATRE